MRERLVALIIALILIVAGIAFIYWPAAPIAAGIGVGVWALFSDFGSDDGEDPR